MRRNHFFRCALVIAAFTLLGAQTAIAQSAGGTVASRTASVDGLRLHYLTADKGPAVILIHGYTQTSLMWRPVVPRLAGQFIVIAPDLPGIGGSEIPKDCLDLKTVAIRIQALAKFLGVQKARIAGKRHRIDGCLRDGKACCDGCLPGVAGWEGSYDSPRIWHFPFNGPTPERLVTRSVGSAHSLGERP